MWAQLIQMQLKPGEDTAELIQLIRSAEQPGSGLVRSIFMRNQADPSRVVAISSVMPVGDHHDGLLWAESADVASLTDGGINRVRRRWLRRLHTRPVDGAGISPV